MSVQLPDPSVSTPEQGHTTQGRVAAGVALIAIGLLLVLVQIVKIDISGWLFLGGLGLIFLVWGLATRTFGLVIPGGVLGGIGLGVFLTELPLDGMTDTASGGLFLLGFSLGWALITLLSPLTTERIQWWPLIPGGIMAAIGAVLLLGGFGLQLLTLIGVAWPLILVVIGVYLLLKRRP
jgi:hypothetical protein